MKHLAKTLPVVVAGFDETRDRLTERRHEAECERRHRCLRRGRATQGRAGGELAADHPQGSGDWSHHARLPARPEEDEDLEGAEGGIDQTIAEG